MEEIRDPLRFRRQFLLANSPLAELGHWQHRQLRDVHLFAHPDLEITGLENPERMIFLLGYIFDPFHPEKTNAEILSDIFTKIHGYEELIDAIKPYTGRYALIYRDQRSFVIFHDPYGVREVYYCTRPNKIICGSQPNLINRFSEPKLEFSKDRNLWQFYNHDMKPIRLGRLWVGDETVFQDVRHLRPNHCLDIPSLSAKRYWPNSRIEKKDLGTSVQLSCRYLEGAIKAVTARYPVMMAVTSGYDSRSLLAASRAVQSQVYYFINKEPPLNDESPDIRVPREMFRSLQIPFHIHEVGGPVDEKFKEILLDNTFWARDRILSTIYNIYFKAHQDKVNLLGLGELGRVYYGKAPHDLDGYYLARSLKYRTSYYATAQCEKWLREARGIAKTYDIDIMKLFLWEELIGNWGVIGNSESDIAIEEFDPYSSHYIGEILISFDRTQGDLFLGMFTDMWPELLAFPFNPPATLPDRIKDWLQRLGLSLPLRRLLCKFDRWRYRKLWSVSLE